MAAAVLRRCYPRGVMGIQLIGMTRAEVARTCHALDKLERYVPEEHAHVRRALRFIRMHPWSWRGDPSVRAYTGPWYGPGMVMVHRPSEMSIEDIAVCVVHEARHIVVHDSGLHSYRYHSFGRRPPTLEERLADPIYAREEETRRVLSAGLQREYAQTQLPCPPHPLRGAGWPAPTPAARG